MMNDLRYKIGDRLFASCFTDFEFEVQIEIMAISNFELANDEYESIFVKMFNSSKAQELLEEYRNSTMYFYICKVLENTILHNKDDYLVLTDTLIDTTKTYYLNEELNLYLNINFSTMTSSYRTSEELINDLLFYLENKKVNCEVYKEKSYEEKLQYELDEYRSIINSLKGLKGMEKLVDKFLNTFNTCMSKLESFLNRNK